MAEKQTDASKKNVFMVVNTYASDDPRVIYSAASLTRLGYHVRLIGAARQRSEPAPARQIIEDVEVLITPTIDGANPRQLFRMLWKVIQGDLEQEIVNFYRGRSDLISLFFFSLWVLRIGLTSRMGVVHCHDLSPLPACWLVARIKRARLIYDIHENVPTMHAGRKGALMTQLELKLVGKADVVIAAGKRLARAMIERGARRVIHIGNWKRLDDYTLAPASVQALRERLALPDQAFIVSHIGTMDVNRELPPLLEAVAQSPDITLLIGGSGPDEDQVISAAKDHANIHWLGWVDLREIPAYTYLSDVIYYCRSPLHYGGSYELAPAPNKLYEAFAAGRPVIARRGVGEIGEILEQIPAGILLDDVTVETLKVAFQQLRDPRKRKVLQEAALQAREQYNWGVAEALLSQIYAELLPA